MWDAGLIFADPGVPETRSEGDVRKAPPFDVVVNSSDVGMCKPDAGIFERCFAALRAEVERRDGTTEGIVKEVDRGGELQREQTLFLDDSAENVAAGRAFGFECVHVGADFVDPVALVAHLEDRLGLM